MPDPDALPGHMDEDTAALLREANALAQRRFKAMIEKAYVDPANPTRTYPAYSDPNAPETVSYIQAERVIDDILGEAQWKAAQEELDALALGDHHVGVGL